MTVYTPLATLENRYSLTTTQLYKLLEALNLTPKKALSACYLNELQLKFLENWIEKSVYSHLPLSELRQALEDPDATYLYQCSNCGHLWHSASLLKEEESLLHACPRTHELKGKHSGHYMLLAVGSPEEMSDLAQLVLRGDWDDSRKLKLAS